MKSVGRSLDFSVEADLRPVQVVISTLGGPTRLPLLASLYVLGLIAIVAIAMCRPLSTFPRLLLLTWLVPFFLFALVAIVCSLILIVHLYSRMAIGLYRRACRRVMRPKPSAPAPSDRGAGVWDHWLDGAGG